MNGSFLPQFWLWQKSRLSNWVFRRWRSCLIAVALQKLRRKQCWDLHWQWKCSKIKWKTFSWRNPPENWDATLEASQRSISDQFKEICPPNLLFLKIIMKWRRDAQVLRRNSRWVSFVHILFTCALLVLVVIQIQRGRPPKKVTPWKVKSLLYQFIILYNYRVIKLSTSRISLL